jgi:thioredoxin-like negative regulator of GroEL
MTAHMDDLIGNVTDATIDEYVGSPAAVVVFGIANCEGCAFMDGVLAGLAPRLNGQVKFGKAKMHVPGACREIKKRYRFETYPTTHLYAHGKLIEKREGKVDSADLDRAILGLLLKA